MHICGQDTIFFVVGWSYFIHIPSLIMVSKENPTHILKVKGNGQDTANTFISQDLYYTCILRNLVGDGKKKSFLLPFFFWLPN